MCFSTNCFQSNKFIPSSGPPPVNMNIECTVELHMDDNPHAETSRSHANNTPQQSTPASHTNIPHQRSHQQQPTETKHRIKVRIYMICIKGRNQETITTHINNPHQPPTPEKTHHPTSPQTPTQTRQHRLVRSFIQGVPHIKGTPFMKRTSFINTQRMIPIEESLQENLYSSRGTFFNELLLEQ